MAISTRFPFTGFRATLDPQIHTALDAVAEQLGQLGHTVMTGGPDYGLRLSWSFLSRSTAGLLDWGMRVGETAELDPRTRANLRIGRALSQRALSKARRHEAASQRRIGAIFDTVDVVVAPTTARPALRVDAFDGLSGIATDRTMIAACPVAWPWNVLGWPSINIPAGFTDAGLPIGVQLMGPANSEPLLISLAAALEALGGWHTRQPSPWWTESS